MKKILLFSLLSFLIHQLPATNTVLLDFETSTVPATVSSWLNYTNAGVSASVWSITNPLSDITNSTPNCYKVTK